MQTTWIHTDFSCFYCLGQILSPPPGRVLLAGHALHHGSQRPWQTGRTPLGDKGRQTGVHPSTVLIRLVVHLPDC